MLILSTQLTLAADWYVTQDGAGDLSGQPNVANAMPVATFNALTGTGYAGSNFYFSETFTDYIVIGISGTSGNYVTLDGYVAGDCNPLVEECTSSAVVSPGPSFAGMYSGWEGVETAANYVIIQDFRITDAATGIQFLNGMSHITIRRNYLHELPARGIDFTWNDWENYVEHTYITIGGAPGQGNKILNAGTGNGSPLFSIYTANNCVVSYNEFGVTDKNTYGYEGVWFYNVAKTLFEYNKVYGINGVYNGWYSEGCVAWKGDNSDTIVRFNDVDDCSGFGIDFINVMENGYIYGNKLSNADAYGNGVILATQGRLESEIARYGVNAPITNINIWSNVLYGNNRNGVGLFYFPCSEWNELEVCYMDDILIANNTIVGNGGYNSYIDAGLSHNNGTNIIAKNNIFSNNYAYTTEQEIYTSNSGELTLGDNNYYDSTGEATLTNIAMEGDAEEADPGFVNAGIYDYRLDGTNNVSEGTDLGECFAVTIQGVLYEPCTNDAINPETTDFTTTPPIVNVLNRDIVGWSRGAYAYQTSGIIPIVLRQFFLD